MGEGAVGGAAVQGSAVRRFDVVQCCGAEVLLFNRQPRTDNPQPRTGNLEPRTL